MTTENEPPRSITTRDGRALAYAEYGDPKGAPALYFHGFPGSRLEASVGHEGAAHLGVRLIAVDRPGFGQSDFQPDRTLLDWPRDVADLADALGLDRFAVLGVSGGGPYAAACAARIPERLTAVGIVSGLAPLTRELMRGMSPLNRSGLVVAARAPRLLRLTEPVIRRVTSGYADGLVRRLARITAEPDRVVLVESGVGAVLAASFREAVRKGAQGMIREAELYAASWGGWLREIPIEVRLWHGGLDRILPEPMGRALERALPRCRAEYHSSEGHFSLIVRQGAAIMTSLRDAGSGR
jgi:pimeloyl-ACP methyl ester carboxylesterase